MPCLSVNRATPDPSDWIVLAVTDDLVLAGDITGHDPERGRYVHRFKDIKTSLLFEIAPSLILAPLVGRDFDATDLIVLLAAVGYRGRVVFIADSALCRDMLTEELQGLAPGLDIDVIDFEAV